MVIIVVNSHVNRAESDKVGQRSRGGLMLDMRNDQDVRAQKPSLVDEAYDALRRAIRNNVFAPGYQGAEQDIARQLGMSRTPVHQAITRLQEEGLVRVLPRRGVLVCALSPDDMREIYEVLIALETASAELIAEKDETDRRPIVAELDDVNSRMQQALNVDDLMTWAEADERFHQLLVERSGNGRLLRMFHTIMDQSHRARMLTLRLRPRPHASVKEHSAVIDALSKGDRKAARERTKRHRMNAQAQILPLLGQFGINHL